MLSPEGMAMLIEDFGIDILEEFNNIEGFPIEVDENQTELIKVG